jgi:FemAB-related protein (PEP-CTERM system-associated)
MTLQIIEHREEKRQEWDDFVKQFSSCFYHQFAWQYVLRENIKGTPCYLSAYENGVLKGVLPLFAVRGIFQGKGLVSLPLADEVGIIAEDERTAYALLEKALQIAKGAGFDFLEIRQNSDIFPHLPSAKSRATFYLKLPSSADILWRTIRSEKRKKIKKAWRSGLHFWAVPPSLVYQWLPVFLRIATLHRRNLGSPFWGASFLNSILRHFPGQLHLFFVEKENKQIGCALGLSFNGRLTVPVEGCLREYFSLAPNNLLYWGILEFACRNGFTLFDFGRSRWNSGPFHFKREWGADVVPLYYYKLSLKEKHINLAIGTDELRSSALIKQISEVWRRSPYLIVKTIGPFLLRYIITV